MEGVSNQTLGTLGDSIIAEFCGDNEGIPQVFVAQFGGTSFQGFRECNSSLPLETTEDEGTDVTTTNIITTTEDEGTDLTTINVITTTEDEGTDLTTINVITTTEDEGTDVTTTNIITITEDEGTDVTTTNTINTMNTPELESDIRDSIIMENGNFSLVLVQVC